MFGFLNIYKPKGITSHDVISHLRKVTNIKQIGHTGTLDPFAQGVLPVCIGKATRLIEFLKEDKEYIATLQFGKNTDTYDIEGQITEQFNKKINQNELISSLENFKGEISQLPPMYSAIKVDGKKLYEYARKGQSVEVKPRKVFINEIELINFDEKNQTAKIRIACSKGTYIRSIAYDLGKILNCGAYLSELIRTKSGLFSIENSINLNDANSTEIIKNNLINPIEMLDLPKIEINEKEHEKVLLGQVIKKNLNISNNFLILIYNNKVSAVAISDGNLIRVKKVFL